MSVFHCERCGRLFSTDEKFMTVDVDSIRSGDREIIAQVLLCGTCADQLDESLNLETTIHEKGR